MDVRFSAEQQQLSTSVARAVSDLGPRTVADLSDDRRVAKLEAAVDAAGWRELRCAAGDGVEPYGSGVDVAIIAEQLGRGLVDVAFIGPTLAAELRRLAALAPSDTPEAVVSSSGVAFDAAGASHALALNAHGGVERVVLGGLDGDVDLTRVAGRAVGGVEVLDGERLGEGDACRWLALRMTLCAADLVGVMAGAVDLGCGYAADRQQFGVAVGSFQAVQHLLADAFVATEGSRSATLHAAWALDALDPPEAVAAAAVAVAYAGRAARTVCETVIQVHGGIGNTWDCLAHVFLRRALASLEFAGGVDAALAVVLSHAGYSEVADGLW